MFITKQNTWSRGAQTLLLLLMCLVLQACLLPGDTTPGYQSMNDQPNGEHIATVPDRKIFLTFLGFHGHESCFTAIKERLQKEDKEIVCIEASPQSASEFSACYNCCGKLDGHIWEQGLACCCISIAPQYHLGLGGVTQQARTAEKRLREQGLLKENDEVILFAQSQGCLVLMEFWRLFRKQYNIKGAVTLVSPFGGAEIIASLSSRQKLQEAAQLVEEGSRNTCCCLPTTSWLACCLPYVVAPAFQCCGYCCCKGLTDMTLGSALTQSIRATCKEMAAAQLPFLNIMAHCPDAPSDFQASPYGPSGTKYLIGGGAAPITKQPKQSDNLIATHSQALPIKWNQAESIMLEADHGLFDVAYSRVFSHPTAIQQTVGFCAQHFGNSEAAKKRKQD